MSLILKGLLAVFWLVFIPGAAGLPLLRKKEKFSAGECFLTGYLLLFAVMEILALPMICLGNIPLHVLTACYAIVAVCMAAWGIREFIKKRKSTAPAERVKRISVRESISWYLAAALVLILLQICIVVLYAHMDADDAFYVGTATTGLETDTIFSISPYTGEPYNSLPRRYVLSPFPVFLAVVSALCGKLHPAIMAHTVFPAVFLAMAYLVLYQYGKKWFSEDKKGQDLFLLFGVVLTWFSGYSVYSAGNFQMVRIWQGKALLAAALLPWLFYLCMDFFLEENPRYSWLFLFMADVACCLLSSMGIILAPLLTGIFMVLGFLKFKAVKQLGYGLWCCLPSLILGTVYVMVL